VSIRLIPKGTIRFQKLSEV